MWAVAARRGTDRLVFFLPPQPTNAVALSADVPISFVVAPTSWENLYIRVRLRFELSIRCNQEPRIGQIHLTFDLHFADYELTESLSTDIRVSFEW